jgi:bifunctional non-homologous end joining protein LigD
MTELLPEFRRLPVRGVFDGELVSRDSHRRPSFERVCRRMLQRDASVPVSLVVFDVLELDAEPTIRLPYRRRRVLLEALDSEGVCEVGPRFEDGAALWQAVCDRRLEGVVAKRLDKPYKPGARARVKAKSKEWPRCKPEREAIIRSRT